MPPPPPTKPVAIITGAGSGIGLAIATHLLTQHSFRVVLAERNPTSGAAAAAALGPDATFIQCDVADQKSQARMFKQAFEWGGRRIDFFHANAGVDDRQSLYEVFGGGKEGEAGKEGKEGGKGGGEEMLDGEGLVKGLNTGCLGVNLEAVVQGLWLFRWYFGRSERGEGDGGKKGKGRFVATSSAAELYCMTQNPQYTASKYGVVGLVRSAGPILAKQDNITVNAICPAFIPTNLCPPEIIPLWPKEHVTPMSTALKAIDAILADDNMTAETIELSQENIYFRKMVDWANESQRWVGEESQGIWDVGYSKVPVREEFKS